MSCPTGQSAGGLRSRRQVRVRGKEKPRTAAVHRLQRGPHTVPAKTTRHNAEMYDALKTIVAFNEFEGRLHFPGAPGWEEVADYAPSWATANNGISSPRPSTRLAAEQ
jgi:hypothetical protein